MAIETTGHARTQIESANREFMAAFGRRDAAAIGRLYTHDAVVLPPNAEMVRGTQSIGELWQSVFEIGATAVTLETMEIEESAGRIVELGRYRLMAGDALADQGKYLVVWMNESGRWKLHRDIWNTSQPAAQQA